MQIRRKEADDKYITLSQQTYALRDLDEPPPPPEKHSFLALLREKKIDINSYMLENSSRPFHYGTHYSSSATVLHYLVRWKYQVVSLSNSVMLNI